MSAFQDLAAPAPDVGAASAEQAQAYENVTVEAARASESVTVDPSPAVEPATITEQSAKKMGLTPGAHVMDPNNLPVAALRKIRTDFESKAAVLQGKPQKNFLRRAIPILFDERDFVAFGEVVRFVFVQGPCCFIYCEETDPKPLYTIYLQDFTAVLEDPKKSDKNSVTVSPRVNTNEARENLATVLLKNKTNGKHGYQFTFDTTHDSEVARRFMNVVKRNNESKMTTDLAEVVHAKSGKK